jgi:capsular polysaccharide transport system permease protein
MNAPAEKSVKATLNEVAAAQLPETPHLAEKEPAADTSQPARREAVTAELVVPVSKKRKNAAAVSDISVVEKAPGEQKPPELRAPVPAATEVPGPGAAKAHAAEVRRARSRRLLKRLAIFVIVPTLVAAAYYGLFATPQFESYSTFTVQSSEVRPTLGMEGLLAGIASGGGHDALAVRDYALSRDMLAQLDKEVGFIAHYRDPSRDFVSRLGASATFEDAYEYFGSKVYADYDQTSGAVTLRVRAFTPDKAQGFAKSVLAASEAMVNKLSERQRRDRTRTAEAELKLAEERLRTSRKAIVALQQKHKDFSPLQTAGAAIEIRTQLEGEMAKARAELMQLKSFMNDNAPQVMAANEKIKAIGAQIAGESRRLVDPKENNGLNASLVDFEAAMTEKEFAEKAYATALAALELARADADRQHRYLAVIAGPSKPDESTYPHRFRSVLAAFVLSFLLLGVVSLLGAAVREHARL